MPQGQQGYDNTNRGVMFRESRKRSDKSPDYSGRLNVNGVEFKLSGWLKEPKNGGEPFLSLAIQPATNDRAGGDGRQQQQPRQQQQRPTQPKNDPLLGDPASSDTGNPFKEDDIPF